MRYWAWWKVFWTRLSLRIGIDASRAVLAERTGTENYSLHLLRALMEATGGDGEEPPWEFTLYCNRPPAKGLFPSSPAWSTKVMPFPRLWTHVRLSWEMMRHPPDLLFVPAHVLPLAHPRRSVVTVHDLGYLHYPETYPPGARRYLAFSTARDVRNAAHVLADSQATKADIVSLLHGDPQRITVVHPGVGPEFQPIHNPTLLSALKAHYGIPGDYLLYVGTLHPKKNLERLVDAFLLAKSQEGFSEQLVLAGNAGWISRGMLTKLREAEEHVRCVGYVSPLDLPLLYHGATALILPSLLEGFGLPVVEAMACGTPVIAANASSLPEVVGEAGVLVDPFDVEAMAQGIAQVLRDRVLREDLRQRGLARAKKFTWGKAAESTLGVLEQVAAA